MKMISQLAAQMVHKMNNPIAAILNRISGLLVRDQDNTDPNLHTELQGIQEQLYTVSLLTNALTAFSKEDRKNFKLVQLNSIVENTLHLLRLFNSEHNVEFQIQLDPDLPRVLGNEVTLEQCFVNICKNAIEAMPSGGLLSIVSKVDDQFPDFVNISFSDRGPGIPAEDLSTVIDPFFTTKDKGHFGLGLSVCFGVISNHNGSVEISSQQGQGTTVQIILPIVKI